MKRFARRPDVETFVRKDEAAAHGIRTPSLRLRAYRLLRKILLGFIFISIVNALFSYFFYTPKIYRIDRENHELVIRYRVLQDRIRTAQHTIDDLRERDNEVYRSLFGTDTLSIEGVWHPYPDTKYAAMADDDFAPLIIGTWHELDALARKIYLESVSLDELQALAHNKEQLSTAVPAIWPINRKALHYNHIGAFNPRRFHPILKRIQPHNGVDFGCDRGTPVFATGDGTVETAVYSGFSGGYGRQILLNHGFGYKTRYAHLDKVLVSKGEEVKRGQLIGLVGNTGRSTAPHLHYEVILRGRPVNPINYFNRDMTPEEYDHLMEHLRETKYE